MSVLFSAIKNSNAGLIVRGTYHNFIEYWPVLFYVGLAFFVGRFSQSVAMNCVTVYFSWILTTSYCDSLRAKDKSNNLNA